MRDDLIKDFERRARTASDTEEFGKVFAEAKVLLSLVEYSTFLSRLWRPAETETSKPSPELAGGTPMARNRTN